MTLAMHNSCFCPCDRLPPSSAITVSYPSGRRLIKPCAWDAFAAAMISSSVASGFPIAMLSRIASAPKPGLLQHHTVIVPAGSLRVSMLQRISFPDFDRAAVHIIKTHQQIDQRRLAAAGRSHDRHSLSRLHRQIKVLNQLLAPAHRKNRRGKARPLPFACSKSTASSASGICGILLDQFKHYVPAHASAF